MAIAEDMRKTTENIITSTDFRLKAVGELVADTHKTLKCFAADRKKMGEQRAKDLAGFVSRLSKNVQGSLKEFQKNRQRMSKEQAKGLSDFVKNLVSDIGSTLGSFDKDRENMSKEINDRLSRDIKDIQTQVKGILDEADKLMGEYSSEMAQARKAWQDMTKASAKARRAGFAMPKIEADEKVTTVDRAATKGKKKAAKKNKSNREPVHSGV